MAARRRRGGGAEGSCRHFGNAPPGSGRKTRFLICLVRKHRGAPPHGKSPHFAYMPLVADLTAALLTGLAAFLAARWYARSDATPERPSVEVARALGETVKPHPGPR